jgi:hypothetical protein
MLEEYNKKRNFVRTPEPEPSGNAIRSRDSKSRFVVQKHDATGCITTLDLRTKRQEY